MDDRKSKTFEVITDFISLVRSILKKHKCVALWDRLIKKGDAVDVERCFKAFTIFCRRNRTVIQQKSLVFPPETTIKYSSHIFIDMNVLVAECDEEDRDTVNEYLLTLSALLLKDEESMNALESNQNSVQSDLGGLDISKLGIDNTTSEGSFINNILGKVTSVMQEGDMSNPQQGIMKLLASGLMNDVTMGAKEKIDSGELTLNGIFECMQQVVKNMEPSKNNVKSSKNNVEEITEESPKDDGVVDDE